MRSSLPQARAARLARQGVDCYDQHEIHQRIEEANRGGKAIVHFQQAFAVNVSGNHIRVFEDKIVV